jgi:type I restriction enzyme S subunit
MSFGHDIAALVADFERGLLAKHPSWPRVKLSEVADLLNGFPYESANFSDANGIPLLRIRDILRGRTETCYKGNLDDPRMLKVRNGDLVVGMDGDFNARIWQGGEALLNQRVCLIRAREEIYSHTLS